MLQYYWKLLDTTIIDQILFVQTKNQTYIQLWRVIIIMIVKIALCHIEFFFLIKFVSIDRETQISATSFEMKRNKMPALTDFLTQVLALL